MKAPNFITAAFILLSFPLLLNAQNGDCPGEAVCTDQAENMIAGSSAELNASNRGCLLAGEATSSYWYQLCVSTSGTIAFAINPNGANNDYDFAIWGPGAACPPTTAPIRCSYAVTSGTGPNGDITGVGNGALDNTEGAAGNGWVAPINALPGSCYVVNINNYAGGSSSFVIDFNGTATLDCALLPVELFSLTANATGDGIEVNWNCHTETNNSHFILERTIDGVNYDFVARIEGAGTSAMPTMYKYVDIMAYAGTNYYRLRQVDYDGHENLYGPIACDYTPVGPSVMEVVNMNGQIVFTGETTNYVQTLNELHLTEGVYVISLTRGTTRRTFKQAILGEMVMPE